MSRLGMLVLALLFCLGCAADGGKGEWAEFWKDVRGDNMQMRSDTSGLLGTADRQAQLKQRD